MTMTTPVSEVLIVPMTVNTAEVRLSAGDSVVHIGQVGAANGQWFWRHRDGEQSSPISGNRMQAAEALAQYHRAFKPQTKPVATRKLLFG
jgi:hypothetical protein